MKRKSTTYSWSWARLIGLALLFNICTLKAQTVQIPDSVFRNMLQTKYPSMIDQNGRLIIAEAAKLGGVLNGSNLPISSIEGIQYFTGIKTISFVRTNLNTIPDLSSLTNLESINLMYNSIQVLPSISKLKRLKILNIHSNFLTTLPDLSQNDSLLEINANSNLLDSLPNLGNLIQLQKLYVHNNRLTKIVGVEKLVSLVEFWCYGNRLGNFASLDKLKNIKSFDASKNLLTSAPHFGIKSNIRIIDIDLNDISTIPDYSKYDSLSKIRLEYNRLTFKELTKIRSMKGFETIVQFSPQKDLFVGKTIRLKEGDSFNFATGIDSDISGVSYKWFKNGTLVNTVSNDSWNIPTIQLSDSGTYTCQLSHPLFANFKLQTDAYVVSTSPCINMNNISFVVSGANCQNSGKLEALLPNSGNLSFVLKSLGSGKVFTSTNGKFESLSEPLYSLTIKTSNGCEKAYSKHIQIPVQKCLDYLLTPNNDGNTDSFHFEANGKVEIYDKFGNLVKRMNIPAEWDCTNEKGKVPNGYYIANINDGETQIGLSIIY